MSSLKYVGIDPNSDAADPKVDLLPIDTTRAVPILNSLPVNRGVVSTQVDNKALLYSGDITSMLASRYAQRDYMLAQDGANVLSTALGSALGVASTDSNNLIPSSQLPSMGNGYLVGPLGITSTQQGSATTLISGPAKIGEWAIGTNNYTFQPLVFMVVDAVTTMGGKPVIEVRISNGQASSYSTSNPLVATGTGRSFFYTHQAISVIPCASSAGQSGLTSSSFTTNYNTYLTVWIYDAGTGTSSVSAGGIVSASAFLVRVTA